MFTLNHNNETPVLYHCRFCAVQKKYEELLDLSKDNETLGVYLKIIEFFKFDYLKLSEELPKTSCEDCYKSSQDAYMFFEKVKESQLVLKNLYNVDVKDEKDYGSSVEDYRSDDESIIKNSEGTIVHPTNITLQPVFYDDDLLEHTNETKQSILKIETHCNQLITEPIKHGNSEHSHNLIDDIYVDTNTYIQTSVSAEEKTLVDIKVESYVSWTSYRWQCHHCSAEFQSMSELRTHSRDLHNSCYAFKCNNCDVKFNTFNAFIEHVRQHREELRYYCQYCNAHFPSVNLCTDHSFTHWYGTQKICELCGEIFPNTEAFSRHHALYKIISLPRSYHNSKPALVTPHEVNQSWADYMWACQHCYLRVSDVVTLRRHVQDVHDRCFSIKCMDCLRLMRNHRHFVAHAIGHRPYLRNYCQYCNTCIKDPQAMKAHINDHLTGPRRPCHGCGQTFNNNREMSQHMKRYNAPRCRTFLTTEDLTCDICFKTAKDIDKFRSHMKSHMAKKCEYTCETCGKAFDKNHALQSHMKTHSVKTEICQVCQKAFHTKRRLKAHVVSHSQERPYICNECGTSFKNKMTLKSHLASHSKIRHFKCSFCEKEFNYRSNLRTHELQHTGLRPYSCKMCEKTFTNWGNCNKHMIGKHGVTLAKTKVTAQGKLEINVVTGEPKMLVADGTVREWMMEVMRPMKRGKKAVCV